MRISVFGLGYVGAVTCACLADLGHEVIGVDVSADKVAMMGRGEPPIMEDGLQELLTAAIAAGRLSTTTDASTAVAATDVAMVCVGTPSTATGGVDSSFLERVCEQIGHAVAEHDPEFFCVMTRSTSVPAVHHLLEAVLERTSGRNMGEGLGYVCHPEFLREGAAVRDFYEPAKIVFGADDERSQKICAELYPGIAGETFVVPVDVAAMVKYADNAFHAVKVTFANEIGMLCKSLDVDAAAVMDLFCQDTKLNISARYLRPGFAFGGSCLPKDVRGLLDTARHGAVAVPMLSGALESNRIQVDQLAKRVLGPGRYTVGLVGLAFKERTDDVRESPAVALVEQLTGKGHPVVIHDRHLAVRRLVGANLSFALHSIPHLAELLVDDLQTVVDRSRVVVVSHRLDAPTWAGVTWPDGVRILDLVGIPELVDLPGYEGLYW
jgi:GDP-mannose 6-dehydrogenase